MMLRFSKRGFTLIELLVVIAVLVFLAMLFIPARCSSSEASRRAACSNNMKQLGLGILNFESAKKVLPGSSTKGWTEAPALGDPQDENNGYSWMVMILPYLEQKNLYKKVDLDVNPWSTQPTDVEGNPVDHSLVWSTDLDGYLCPSRSIDNKKIDPSPYPQAINHAGGTGVDTIPAATSYVALSATHFASLARTETSEWAGGKKHPNGVMYPGSKIGFRGIKDGSSNTAIVCETKEPTYAAWYDGTTAGVVGLKSVAGFEQASDEKEKYGVPIDGVVAINYGNPRKNQYYCDGESPFTKISKWTYGPSSDHPGVVLHLFCDGSVHSLSAGTAPEIYMNLISREGGEPVTLP